MPSIFRRRKPERPWSQYDSLRTNIYSEKIPSPVPSTMTSPVVPQKFKVTDSSESFFYSYRSLGGDGMIRLLEIQPATDSSSPIRCKLLNINVSDDPSYRAVSYKWGNGEHNRMISVNDSQFAVRENLIYLLADLRPMHKTITLWIDAICINQRNKEERSEQVRMMGDIYANAEEVIVWIKGRNGPAAYLVDPEPGAKIVCREIDENLHQPAPPKNELEGFFGCEYWERRWIIQEVGLARSVTVRCGQATFALSKLQSFISRYDGFWLTIGSKSYPLRNTLPARLGRLQQLEKTQREQQALPIQSRTLQTLLLEYYTSKCQDPRDCVFALLSLVPQAKEHVRIDYTLRPVETLGDVVLHSALHESLSQPAVMRYASLLRSQLCISVKELQTAISKPRPSNEADKICMDLFFRGSVRSKRLSAHNETLKLKYESYKPDLNLYSYIKFTDPCSNADSGSEDTKSLHSANSIKTLSGTDVRIFEYLQAPGSDTGSEVCTPGSASDKIRFQDLPTTPTAVLGFANIRVLEDDEVWQFSDVKVAFIVRKIDNIATIVGRAILLQQKINEGDTTPYSWIDQNPDGAERNLLVHTMTVDVNGMLRLLLHADLVEADKNVSPDPVTHSTLELCFGLCVMVIGASSVIYVLWMVWSFLVWLDGLSLF